MNMFHYHPKLSKFIFTVLLIITVLFSWTVRIAGAGWILIIYGIPMIIITLAHIGIHLRAISKIPLSKSWGLALSNVLFFLSLALQYDGGDSRESEGIALFKFMGFFRSYSTGIVGYVMKWLEAYQNSEPLVIFAYILLFVTWGALLYGARNQNIINTPTPAPLLEKSATKMATKRRPSWITLWLIFSVFITLPWLGIRLITLLEKGSTNPIWSLDGQQIIFVSGDSDKNGSIINTQIYAVNIDGSGLKPLIKDPAGDQWRSWSPNRQQIAFSLARDIYVINANGSGLTRLTNDPEYAYFMAWSPDGKQIAFASKRDGNVGQIYVINVDGTGLKRLTNDPSFPSFEDWSPDGQRILFESDRDDPNLINTQLYMMNADGSGVKRLTNSSTKSMYASWSPNGEQIAYFSPHGDFNWDIYVINTDGSHKTKLTDSVDVCCKAIWSPNSQKIAYVMTVYNSERETYIYVMNADGSDSHILTDSLHGQNMPAWSRDNQNIVFTDLGKPIIFGLGFWTLVDFRLDQDIYIVKTDGSGLRNLTKPPTSAFIPVITLPLLINLAILLSLVAYVYIRRQTKQLLA